MGNKTELLAQWQCVTASECHSFRMSLLQNVTASECHSFRMSLLQNVTASECHCLRMSLPQNVTASECHSFRMSQLQNVTASECHSFRMSLPEPQILTDWLIDRLAEWLSTWSRILLEKLLVPQNQEISCILQNLKVHYHVHNSPPLFLILMQTNLNHILPPHFFMVYFNTIILSVCYCANKKTIIKQTITAKSKYTKQQYGPL
jgi:hypothetical protein